MGEALMNTVVRLGLAGCLALLAMPLRAEEKVDTSNIMVKQAIADTMTPEQLRAYKERIARNLARRRNARVARRAAVPGPDTPADTCLAATLENGPLPYNATGTTVGDTDDFDLPADTTNPTCAASTNCTGAGPAGSLPRGAIYTGTGVGPDRAYHFKTDANCDLAITMDPTGTEDLALIVYQTQCSSLLADCVCVDDTGVGGVSELVTLNAVANTDYFVVIDGYSTGGTPPGPAGPFTLGLTTTGTCNLVGSGVLGVYHTVTPCRLVDTRNAPGPYGGPALVAGADRTIDVDGGACGVPATADAVFLNITVDGPADAGNLRLWPTGTAFPTVSALNFNAGQTRGNNGIFKLNASGQFDIRSNQNTHVIIDVAGYFEE
jgi:hypothetical protein